MQQYVDLAKQTAVHESGLKYQSKALVVPLQTQEAIATELTFLMVTTCLYLSFNSRAKSLSTLMAVTVNNDTVIEMLLAIPRPKTEGDNASLAPSLENGDPFNTVSNLCEANAEIIHLQRDYEAILWRVDEATFLCEGRLGSQYFQQLQ